MGQRKWIDLYLAHSSMHSLERTSVLNKYSRRRSLCTLHCSAPDPLLWGSHSSHRYRTLHLGKIHSVLEATSTAGGNIYTSNYPMFSGVVNLSPHHTSSPPPHFPQPTYSCIRMHRRFNGLNENPCMHAHRLHGDIYSLPKTGFFHSQQTSFLLQLNSLIKRNWNKL